MSQLPSVTGPIEDLEYFLGQLKKTSLMQDQIVRLRQIALLAESAAVVLEQNIKK
jgi:hypothetical protein